MQRFTTVSYANWENPYTGATGTGQSFYTTSVPKPVYRRIVAPSAPKFSYPGVVQVIGDSDDSDEEFGRCRHNFDMT